MQAVIVLLRIVIGSGTLSVEDDGAELTGLPPQPMIVDVEASGDVLYQTNITLIFSERHHNGTTYVPCILIQLVASV